MKLEGKRALVIGAGKSGVAAANALARSGAAVFLYDRKPGTELDGDTLQFLEYCCTALFFGGKEPETSESFDLLVMSPGVPTDLPLVRRVTQAGAMLIGELELAYQLGKGRYIAITGTNGKTTTTVLTGEIFRNAGRKTEVVGNVGLPVTQKALEAEDDTYLITECSSFQLETIQTFHPQISALLNLTPDHLDRHKTLDGYGRAKARVYLNQDKSDYFIVNLDDPESCRFVEACPATVVPFSRKQELDLGASVKNGMICMADQEGTHQICPIRDIRIPGAHNLENALAATAIAWCSGIPAEVIARTLREFAGVAHRMEPAGELHGVTFVNDSKGTNPDASIKAIEAIEGGIVLIAGGYDKKSDYEDLIRAFGSKVRALVLLGKTADDIQNTAEGLGYHTILRARDMKESVEKAYAAAHPGDTVLLSPACASWDMYSCFEERGEDFKSRVAQLMTTASQEVGPEEVRG